MTDASLPTSLTTFTPTKLPTFARSPKWWSAGVPAALAGPVCSYLKHFQRQLKHRPTDVQRRLMMNAALAGARFDLAVGDAALSGSSVAHLERVRRLTARQMYASFPKRQPPRDLPLDVVFANGIER